MNYSFILEPSEYFFVNAKRKRFGPLLNTAILKEFSEVTQITKATTNTFRKSMEATIQSDHAMKTRSKDISSHSARTGSKYYDPSKGQFRASAMQFINEREVSYESETEVPANVAASATLSEMHATQCRRVHVDNVIEAAALDNLRATP